MPWSKDYKVFWYTKKLLRTIASNYITVYECGLPLQDGLIVNLFSIAEYKADFDQALKSIGRGKWNGEVYPNMSFYRSFGRLQRSVISDILKLKDDDPRLTGYAYYLMTLSLNQGGEANFEANQE